MKNDNFEEIFKVNDENTGKKIVYITADEKCMKYAHRLQTLISEMQNVKCCIYTKRIFIDNLAKASSDNLIIFIGENDISRQTIELIEKRESLKFGISYGWKGTRAVLWVENIFWRFREKKDFCKYYEDTYKHFKKVAENYKLKDGFLDVIVLFGSGLIGLGIKKIIIDNFINGKKIEEAQYYACMMEFVKNGLEKFIEER